jgi:hypothetical protein
MIEPDLVSGYAPGKSTKTGFEDVEILAKDEDADLYTLKVDLHQAEELSHLLASADDTIMISIVLRPDGDNRVIDRSSYGETNNRIIEQYNLPSPMIIDLDTYVQPSSAPAPFVRARRCPVPRSRRTPVGARCVGRARGITRSRSLIRLARRDGAPTAYPY